MKRSRRGVSLAELLVVMIACMTLITLSSQLICRVMRAHIDSRGNADVERNALRLSRQFRSDAHRAFEVEVDADGKGGLVALELASGEVAEYRYHDHDIVRTLSREGQLVRVEEYAFPESIKCNVEQLRDPTRLQLTALAMPSPIRILGITDSKQPALIQPSNPVHLHVEVVVGRDLRLASAAELKEGSE